MKYEPSLDGLRALAALSVIFCHAAPRALPGFGLGVDVFFVLSGYLITSLLSAELGATGRIAYADFIMRRLRRLYPALLVFVGVMYPVIGLLWPGTQWQALPAVLYLMDLLRVMAPPKFAPALGHTWSLALEFQFYLLWPLLLPWVLRARRPLLVLAAAYAALTAIRPLIDSEVASNFRCTGLLIGAMVALAKPSISRAWAAVALLLIATAMLAAVPLSLSLVELFTGLLVASLRGSQALAWRPLVGLGKISYGVYLWHYPIALALHQRGLSPWLIAASATGGAILLASISYILIERPVQRRFRLRAPQKPLLQGTTG